VFGIEVDTSDLLRWARYLNTVTKKTKPAIARALNTVGDNAVKTATEYIAEQMGFDPDDVADMIIVKRASPDDLSFEINMQKIGSGDSRSWDGRDGSDSSFEKNTLVKIVTSGDEKVCQLCLDAAENSPYTLEEVNDMNPLKSDDAGGLLATEIVHKNCRCMVQNWQATRQLPVRLSGVGGDAAPPELFTMRQLGQAIAGELEVVIKAV
jgi:hypothetical protein